MNTFKAFRIHQAGKGVEARLEDLTLDDLGAGEVVIRGHWSSINYKDALAATGTWITQTIGRPNRSKVGVALSAK